MGHHREAFGGIDTSKSRNAVAMTSWLIAQMNAASSRAIAVAYMASCRPSGTHTAVNGEQALIRGLDTAFPCFVWAVPV